MSKCFPFADYEAKGGGEAFTAEPFFTGDFFDGFVIAAFEVDDALEVFGGHGEAPCVFKRRLGM